MDCYPRAAWLISALGIGYVRNWFESDGLTNVQQVAVCMACLYAYNQLVEHPVDVLLVSLPCST